MARRFALYFGAVGYLLVIWYNGFAFAPVKSEFFASLLYACCPLCTDNMGAGLTIVTRRAPINAALYAIVGYVIGRIIQSFRRKSV